MRWKGIRGSWVRTPCGDLFFFEATITYSPAPPRCIHKECTVAWLSGPGTGVRTRGSRGEAVGRGHSRPTASNQSITECRGSFLRRRDPTGQAHHRSGRS